MSPIVHNQPLEPAQRPLAIYIHWPFCKSKCPYCDFNSHVRDSVEQERWKNALLAELEWMATQVEGRIATSIFFGGGTPSLMPPATAQALIDRVYALFSVASDIEITLEANPTSVEVATFPNFRNAGINRVSLGVQSLRAEALHFLGREHNAQDAIRAIGMARDTFSRYSFDLIYAQPGQTLAQWEEELTEALGYADKHLSLYQLTIETGTAFYHAYAKGGFVMPDEDTAEAHYRLTESMLAARGLSAYEVSNYAAAGEESRHNLAYWKGTDYLGIGPGAHGRLTLPRSRCAPTGAPMEQGSGLARSADRVLSRIATQTLKSPERWLENVERQGHAVEVWQAIAPQEEIEERLMMGLRLKDGIDYADFTRQTGVSLEAHINIRRRDFLITKGLIENNPARLAPTLAGRLVLNTLTAELLN